MCIKGLVAAAVLIAPLLAQEVQGALVVYASDAEFLANADFQKIGGANVRWGNGAGNGDWEYAVVNAADAPLAQGQVAWTALPGYASGSETTANSQFTFSFTAAGLQTLALRDGVGTPIGSDTDPGTSGVQLSASASVATPPGGFNTLAVRARAAAGDVAVVGPGGSSAGFRIHFDSGGFIDVNPLTGDADAEYVVLVDERLSGGFWVTDDATIRDGSGSLPMWQFKVGLTPVPAPDSLALLLCGGCALALTLAQRRSRG